MMTSTQTTSTTTAQRTHTDTRKATCIRDTNEATLRKATSLANSAWRRYRHTRRVAEEAAVFHGTESQEYQEAEATYERAEREWEEAEATRALVGAWCEYWSDSEWDCDSRLTESRLTDLCEAYHALMVDLGWGKEAEASAEAVAIVAGAL